MAIIKIKSECYDTLYDVSNLISYVLNPDKLENNIWGSRYLYLYNNPIYSAKKIADINTYYGKTQGSIVKHLIISYPYLQGQCTPQMAEYAIKQMLNINLPGFPYIYALHEDTSHLHFHIIFGTV
ncbi:MAG: relaxase/mobilization nuclease domain-containing protein, partial [Ruminococcus flavefaciens]|nr:relaxase/mobilization nuclease domain-containing protein [Ruminococcus flavefaciens]